MPLVRPIVAAFGLVWKVNLALFQATTSLICLAMDSDRLDWLELPAMLPSNTALGALDSPFPSMQEEPA